MGVSAVPVNSPVEQAVKADKPKKTVINGFICGLPLKKQTCEDKNALVKSRYFLKTFLIGI
jgi:hypothetical protein